MRDLIKRILREDLYSDNIRKLTWKMLSDEDMKNIKGKGEKIFNKFNFSDFQKLNDFFKEHGLYYGAPSKEYLKKNITDIGIALKSLPLRPSTYQELVGKKDLLELQLDSVEKFERGESKNIARHFEFFHELSSEQNEKKVWSIANLFDNNIKLWLRIINDWLETNKNIKKTSVSEIINQYFEIEDGRKAFVDLVHAIIDRVKHNENIIKHTWGGGQKVEQDFKNELMKRGFGDNDVYIFSGEKNIVDGVGIDLAVKCDGDWIPIQVKSSEAEARKSIPYEGLSTFPFDNSFILIQPNRVQIKLSDFCKPVDKPTDEIPKEKPVRGTPPSSVDYFASQGIKTP